LNTFEDVHLRLQLQNYTLQQCSQRIKSCSVGLSENMGFQFRSELSATVVRGTEVRWKCVPDDWSRDGETSLADGRVSPRNEQVAAASRTERPTWQVRNWVDDLLEVDCDKTSTSDTVEGQSSNLELYPRRDWQPAKSVTKHRCDAKTYSPFRFLNASLYVCSPMYKSIVRYFLLDFQVYRFF